MIAIKNAKIILENSVLEDGVLLVEKDTIAEVGSAGNISIPENCEIFDADGLYLGPGFVDIHVHGGNGYMFGSNPKEAAEYFLNYGVTTVLATLYYDLGKEEFLTAVKKVKDEILKNGSQSSIAGFYMEGPYMNPKYGASPEKNKWKGEIKEKDYRDIVKEAAAFAKVWAVAPERKGVEDFVRFAKKINPSAVISVGHSEASPVEVRNLKKYGLCLETHCMNATGKPQPQYSGTKTCGPDEACFLDDDMYAELICDSEGIHVSEDLLRLILKVKGKDRVILISDSFVSNEKAPESLSHIKDLQFDSGGNLCGSKLTLNVACRNMIKHTGCSINDVFLMASRNPAKLIGMDNEIGTIKEGKSANLVLIDDEFNVKKVMFNGQFIK